ncbi:sensor histidine kinase [Thermomonospora umbrina]|uniref:histidine kinase n=1 Tax=Thermomonospora umbrina TaxID=111806 RepID=A0A3D9SYT4_9ACTN|nr:histidine kinase [Thermomonospora umbrina]REF01110.1 signal transduction histidine kinase [Thermomonospora umbrina]
MRFTTRQDALFAVAALAGGLLFLSAHGYTDWESDGTGPGVGWRVPSLLGVSGAMLFRRTRPLVGLAVATPASLLDIALGPSLGTMLIYTDSLYAAGLYGPRRTAERLLGVTATVTVLLAGGVGLWFAQWSVIVVTGGVAGMTWVGPVLTAMVVRAHRDKAELERQRAEQLARLGELDRRNAVVAERARMARELHDVIANHLSAVALHSSAVLRLPDLDREGIRQAMQVIRDNSVQGLAEMRRMIGLLREEPDRAADPPAAPRLTDLKGLVERAARPDLTVGLEVSGTVRELPAAVELAAYRIVQESLTNVLKHAGPGRAEVVVEHRPDRVRVRVDSPLGAERTELPGAGSGLVGMRERASILRGGFTAGRDGDRWVVRAELPTSVSEDGVDGGLA